MLAFICGCADSTSLYPLRIGESWTYTVNNSFTTRVQQVKVMRHVPVDQTEGYELSGPMGIARLAWKGGVLYASALPNVRLIKPMPILAARDQALTLNWSGQVQNLGRTLPAQAILSQSLDSVDVGAQKMDAVKATLDIKFDARSVELTTWYAKGVGPVRQDQRTNGKLDYHVDLLGGP